ncbi:uncharacterized protein LOC110443478 [Mizuhopecten yessoensis]|uniref:Uncharacterized protein n=1 Tax=Mizuhopecten yessoensis TaxID=6573 RepID=A0A210PEU3_MIZYE|nr:uncharacterized protein LOC110443478 [Mizuhopecten yessoensis]OWF35004.1 hypothetical protein KP79_PYT22207 [Mizuhopecten yessoensis]
MGCIGCCGGLGRCCIVLINMILIVVFALILLLFTVVWIYPDLPLVLDMYEGDVKSEMQTSTVIKVEDDWHITKFSLYATFLYLVWAVAGVGLLLSICGCVASCCKYKGCICAYSIIVLILVVAQPVALIMLPIADANPILGTLRSILEDSFSSFQGMAGGTDDDNAWTFVMWKNTCCGVEGYKLSEAFLQTLSSTKSCCPPAKVLLDTCTKADMYEMGCVDALYDKIAGTNGYIQYCPFLLGLQFMLVFFGCCMVLKLQLKNQVSEELEERLPPKLVTSKTAPKDNVFAVSFGYQ